ncbi:PREDICTED: uncharacterized protein LOC108762784 [Trachymyrmex cornetzi]|uniref:uncharacterized protein LOC108762784 n=1 Tax=Trachymyrmex cornetzi TaxID=471704 RepID=UPI00084F6661|nr:PREDICTED: uncharacterized protein LOC108762784 [Trachymyrmex cornetzi]
MFAALFAFVLVTVYAAEELPSYIHVCGLNNPNYGQCIVDNINNINNKICTGMPELNVPPLEPINIDELVIYNTDNLKLSVKESKITGFCNFVINSLQVSSDKHHFDLDVTFKHLDMESVYDFDMHVLVPLANKGMVHVSADNLEAKIILDLKVETKNGKTEIYISKVKTILDVKTFKYVFDDSEKDLVQLHEALSNVVNENEKDIIIKVKPALEEAVSKLIITVVNNIFRNRYEQLFPNEA